MRISHYQSVCSAVLNGRPSSIFFLPAPGSVGVLKAFRRVAYLAGYFISFTAKFRSLFTMNPRSTQRAWLVRLNLDTLIKLFGGWHGGVRSSLMCWRIVVLPPPRGLRTVDGRRRHGPSTQVDGGPLFRAWKHRSHQSATSIGNCVIGPENNKRRNQTGNK